MSQEPSPDKRHEDDGHGNALGSVYVLRCAGSNEYHDYVTAESYEAMKRRAEHAYPYPEADDWTVEELAAAYRERLKDIEQYRQWVERLQTTPSHARQSDWSKPENTAAAPHVPNGQINVLAPGERSSGEIAGYRNDDAPLARDVQTRPTSQERVSNPVEDTTFAPSTTACSETPRTDAFAMGVAAYSNDDVKLRDALAHGRELERELSSMTERWKLQCDDAEQARLEQAEVALSATARKSELVHVIERGGNPATYYTGGDHKFSEDFSKAIYFRTKGEAENKMKDPVLDVYMASARIEEHILCAGPAPSPLGDIEGVLAEYDGIVGRMDYRDAEADFVMRGSDWRVIREALNRADGGKQT